MTEMAKLIKALEALEIPHEVYYQNWFDKNIDYPQVFYPSKENAICDAICHPYSYGFDEGLLEIMGLVPDEVGDDVEGHLTAEDVLKRIIEHRQNEVKKLFEKEE